MDISKTILKYAEKNLNLNNVKIKLLKEDITSLENINEKFDFIFCYATFYHIPPHLMGISLMKIRSLLKEDGKFFVDFAVREKRTLKDYIFQIIY
ncbi:MAG: class I SAM-dependent methyltransferase [Candidatus Pacearchaeota archaeon]